jgi:hypothetical protein
MFHPRVGQIANYDRVRKVLQGIREREKKEGDVFQRASASGSSRP